MGRARTGLLERIHRRTSSSFTLRISRLFLISLMGLSFFVVTFSAVVLGFSYLSSEKNLARRQEDVFSATLEKEVASLYQLGQLSRANSVLLEDLTTAREQSANYAVLNNDVFIELLHTAKLNNTISQITLLKYLDHTVKTVGSRWLSPEENAVLYEQVRGAYALSAPSVYPGMRQDANTSFFDADITALRLYFPVFNPQRVYQQVGLIVFSIEEEALSGLYSGTQNASALLVDEFGVIISASEKQRIGEHFAMGFPAGTQSGIDFRDGQYVIWNHLAGCGWYIVMQTPLAALIRKAIFPFALEFVPVMLLCVAISMWSYYRIRRMLSPLKELQTKMSIISSGDMTTRMDTVYREEEFREMSHSFNAMVANIDRLMSQIRDEQTQMKQIELNALQSQIKPHFLYNALECIHWQALLNGDQMVSELVKALASFYRLCLSKGQEIVTLEQELSHMQSYLVIQNIRYGDIIRCEVDVPAPLLATRIPKMTLQPLIENAIDHGIKIRENARGLVCISGRVIDGKVVLTVQDNGAGMTLEQVEQLNTTIGVFDERYGYGVRNVHNRLQIFFGKEYGLTYRFVPEGGCMVNVTLPISAQEG